MTLWPPKRRTACSFEAAHLTVRCSTTDMTGRTEGRDRLARLSPMTWLGAHPGAATDYYVLRGRTPPIAARIPAESVQSPLRAAVLGAERTLWLGNSVLLRARYRPRYAKVLVHGEQFHLGWAEIVLTRWPLLIRTL